MFPPSVFLVGDGDVLVVWLRRPPLDVGIVDRANKYFFIIMNMKKSLTMNK